MEVQEFFSFFADSSKIISPQLLSDILREDFVVCQSLFGFIDHPRENFRRELALMLSFARGIVSFSKSFMFSSYVSFQTTLAFASLVTVLPFDVVLLDLEYKCLF